MALSDVSLSRSSSSSWILVAGRYAVPLEDGGEAELAWESRAHPCRPAHTEAALPAPSGATNGVPPTTLCHRRHAGLPLLQRRFMRQCAHRGWQTLTTRLLVGQRGDLGNVAAGDIEELLRKYR
jgi:hypothetical protein